MFNEGVASGPQNPVVYNEPGGSYTCQPGNCAYQSPEIDVSSTNERYFFCGYQAQLPGENCSIDDSSRMIEDIGGNFATPEPAGVSDILESSLFLNASRYQYPASQYGAVFFSHEIGSVLESDGSSYRNVTVDKCLSDSGNYSSDAVCQRFGGVGYTIQYNYTAMHVSPLFQGLADEALVRQHRGTDDFTATVTIDPMPITAVESGFAASEAATPLWMLVVFSFPFVGGAYAG